MFKVLNNMMVWATEKSLQVAGLKLAVQPVRVMDTKEARIIGRKTAIRSPWLPVVTASFCLLAASAMAAPSAPTITTVSASGTNTFVGGTFAGTPNTAFVINFYEGATTNLTGLVNLGSVSITNDASGNGHFSVSIPQLIPANSYITVTATDPLNNVSDFANSMEFIPVNPVNITMSVIASHNSLLIDDQVSYVVTLSNIGTNDATDVVVNDVLPVGLNYAYSAVSHGSATVTNNSVLWNLDVLPMQVVLLH